MVADAPNVPRRAGAAGAYEIWFLCVFDPDARRALWLRMTTLAPIAGEARAIVWAAAFDASARRPVVGKAIFPREELALERERLGFRVGATELEDGRTRGEVRAGGRTIAWDLRFPLAPVKRGPRLFDRLPLPAHVEHAADRARFLGWLSIDGARHDLGPRARGVQEHIWGARQPQEILWIYAPDLRGEDDGACEIASVRLVRRPWAPRMTTVHVAARGLAWERRELPLVLEPRIRALGPGVLEIRSESPGHVLVARAHADPRTFAGYIYRDPTGSEVHVAQSDVAACEIEIYRRAGPFLRPERRLFADIAALEIHRPEPLAGVEYIPWDATAPASPPRARPLPAHGAEHAPLPAPSAILALGLTYADHLRETGSRAPAAPIVFPKDARSWLPEGDEVQIPSQDELLAALSAIEPGLGAALAARFAFVPAIMDHEIELGVMLLEPVRAAEIDRAAPRLGFFVANDVTARACQIMGEGAADPYRFWSAAKGFPGFLPVGPTMWTPARATLDAWPEVRLTLRVGEHVRQRGTTKDLVYTPRQMLHAASRALGGDLPEGLALVTGTPAGVALRVSRIARALGDRLLDRFGKLGAAIDAHARSARFPRAGDVLACDGGPLGTRAVRLVTTA